MSDYKELIERLNNQAKGDKWHVAALAKEALASQAEEISRLRGEVTDFKVALTQEATLSGELTARAEAAEARLAEAVEVIRWVDRRPGLGLEVYDKIGPFLAKLEKPND